MKHSIRTKITLLLTTMVILTIFITWFINRTCLSYFYVNSKESALNEVYNKIDTIYNNSAEEENLSDKDTRAMEHLESKYGVDIYVLSTERLIYPMSNYISERENKKAISIIQDYIGFSDPNILDTDKRLLKHTKVYSIFSLFDRQVETSYIDLIGFFNTNNSKVSSSEGDEENDDINNSEEHDADYLVLIRTNFESIEESVAIANEFLAYVGILAVIIGSIAMFIISKKFTKPIKDLSGIAKKMSDLDFEIKYNVNTNDEIGELGSSINTLSDKLESTITELKHANNELMTDIQRKTEIDEMRKEFLSNVSHELKTPISLIQGYAEGLKENINDDEESRDFYCEVIIDEADKMNRMVKKLLSLNELEFGNNQVNFERFDIVALIHSVLEATDILFKQKEVTLYFEQTEPVYVWADEFLIEQVVTNYISNALNHVSGQKIIEIKLISREDSLRVAVFNTGDNIPEDELDKIWIKFYKVDKARTREYGGSGIGLSIVKAIMNSHNRECGAINRPIGVEFWFEVDIKS